MIVLIQILLAHLIGDFLLQSGSAVKQKEEKKWRAPFLYLHVALHFVLILLITWNPSLWLAALVIAATHLIIDGLKLQFQKDGNRMLWFFADQALHVAVILATWYFLIGQDTAFPEIWHHSYWYIITGAVLLTMPAGIVIGVLLSPYADSTGEHAADSLPNAGRYIGILERLLVFLFILLGQWAVIGFLLAAKSVFRFGDLTRARDRKLTEYILIGTLLSFGLAIAVGLGVKFLI